MKIKKLNKKQCIALGIILLVALLSTIVALNMEQKHQKFESALKMIDNNDYDNAKQVLVDLNGYKNSEDLIAQMEKERSGTIVEQTELMFGIRLDLDNTSLYSSSRANTELVNATVSGFYIKGVPKGDITITFKNPVNEDSKLIGDFSIEDKYFSGKGTLYMMLYQGESSGFNLMRVYEGGFDKSVYSGKGTLYWENGKRYAYADFLNGNVEGQYKRWFQDGSSNDSGSMYSGKYATQVDYKGSNSLPNVATVKSLPSSKPAASSLAGEFWCLGKNDTCQNKTSTATDLYCSSCDTNNDNIED